MQERRYLLDIRQMLEGDGSERLLQRAFERIDGERRRKAFPIKSTRAQASGVGAGLLIQKALSDHMSGGQKALQGNRVITGQWKDSRMTQNELREEIAWQRLSVEELLMTLKRPVIEPCYKYGENGKPYLEGVPFHFNLSHSGDYVFCGVSAQEIGVDIQKLQGENELGLARRFFSSAEGQALEACRDAEDRRRVFFRMWTRKEAYGKLTGEGLKGVMKTDLWTDGTAEEVIRASGTEKERAVAGELRTSGPERNGLLWEEYEEPSGYQIAVCRLFSPPKNA